MAKTIMSMERSVAPDQARKYLETYSMKLSASERGVMVIKAQDKTRASQRKGALSNWKVTHNKSPNSSALQGFCPFFVYWRMNVFLALNSCLKGENPCLVGSFMLWNCRKLARQSSGI